MARALELQQEAESSGNPADTIDVRASSQDAKLVGRPIILIRIFRDTT
jgi:hypothetical protein